jgi:ABC-type Zn2+ transport system substrate-binding protein/surface adhesin
MVPTASQAHSADHSHGHAHSQGHAHDSGHDLPHAHAHVHGPASPHPAQAAPWSILRMTLAWRLLAALAVCAVLWSVVWLAMR